MNSTMPRFESFEKFLGAVKEAANNGCNFGDCSFGFEPHGGSRYPRGCDKSHYSMLFLSGDYPDGKHPNTYLQFKPAQVFPGQQAVWAVESVRGVFFNDTPYGNRNNPMWAGEFSEEKPFDLIERLRKDGLEILRVILVGADSPPEIKDYEEKRGYSRNNIRGMILYAFDGEVFSCFRTEFAEPEVVDQLKSRLGEHGIEQCG